MLMLPITKSDLKFKITDPNIALKQTKKDLHGEKNINITFNFVCVELYDFVLHIVTVCRIVNNEGLTHLSMYLSSRYSGRFGKTTTNHSK